MTDNKLYYGDNLDLLRRHVTDETVDLVYLDPPFNSNRSYNVMFQEKSGAAAQAQIEAFDDTWTWSQESEALYFEMLQGDAPNAMKDALEVPVVTRARWSRPCAGCAPGHRRLRHRVVGEACCVGAGDCCSLPVCDFWF